MTGVAIKDIIVCLYKDVEYYLAITMNRIVYNNTNENKDQYVKRNKLNPEIHMFHDLTHMLNPVTLIQ